MRAAYACLPQQLVCGLLWFVSARGSATLRRIHLKASDREAAVPACVAMLVNWCVMVDTLK